VHEAALACSKLTRGVNRRSAYPSEVIMSRRLRRGEKTTRQGGWQGQMYHSQEGRQMKFAVMGAGDFGGRYGGRLVNAGLDVTFIARGQRYDEIKRHGLHILPDSQGRSIDIDRV
jgi:lactate dehydrogenase-like 2-hydroxyacid dehydrogenase